MGIFKYIIFLISVCYSASQPGDISITIGKSFERIFSIEEEDYSSMSFLEISTCSQHNKSFECLFIDLHPSSYKDINKQAGALEAEYGDIRKHSVWKVFFGFLSIAKNYSLEEDLCYISVLFGFGNERIEKINRIKNSRSAANWIKNWWQGKGSNLYASRFIEFKLRVSCIVQNSPCMFARWFCEVSNKIVYNSINNNNLEFCDWFSPSASSGIKVVIALSDQTNAFYVFSVKYIYARARKIGDKNFHELNSIIEIAPLSLGFAFGI
ncbi:MAG: hypothetical protein KAH32_04065 [Chlamydiia bacterium]|nr:hypothetical protein [Chlamydiia bacterium]